MKRNIKLKAYGMVQLLIRHDKTFINKKIKNTAQFLSFQCHKLKGQRIKPSASIAQGIGGSTYHCLHTAVVGVLLAQPIGVVAVTPCCLFDVLQGRF